MQSTSRATALAVLLLMPVYTLGCANSDNSSTSEKPNEKQSAESHDPHDHPITEADVDIPATYPEAVARIRTYRDAIRDGANSSEPGVAHRPLDEADIVLRKLPSIARDSGVPQEQWETINVTARELRNHFNEVHAAIDEKRKPDYAAVSDAIEMAIARLENASKAPDKASTQE